MLLRAIQPPGRPSERLSLHCSRRSTLVLELALRHTHTAILHRRWRQTWLMRSWSSPVDVPPVAAPPWQRRVVSPAPTSTRQHRCVPASSHLRVTQHCQVFPDACTCVRMMTELCACLHSRNHNHIVASDKPIVAVGDHEAAATSAIPICNTNLDTHLGSHTSGSHMAQSST